MVDEQNGSKQLPPYVSFKTFTNVLAELRAHGVPDQIDRSVLPSMSGSAQSAVVKAFEALRLIDGKGVPNNDLRSLVGAAPGSDDYKGQLRALMEAAFPYLFGGKLNLRTTTTNALSQAFREQGASGSTVAKAIAFLLGAAKDAGIEVSKFVRVPPMSEVGSKKRTPAARNSEATDPATEEDFAPVGPAGVDLHPALTGVLATLPVPGQSLSEQEREIFLTAFKAVLALVYPAGKA
jgi:hypothetical protein